MKVAYAFYVAKYNIFWKLSKKCLENISSFSCRRCQDLQPDMRISILLSMMEIFLLALQTDLHFFYISSSYWFQLYITLHGSLNKHRSSAK